MGAILEMTGLRPLVLLALAATLLLSGCGNDSSADDYQRPVKAIIAKLKAGRAAALPTLATLNGPALSVLRGVLEDDGQPIYLVEHPTLKYTALMAPYGQNGDVQTWASEQYETISLRGGILIATRGFGADLMSSAGPSVVQIASGQGATHRSYYYLDGADQRQRFDFDCALSPKGNESVVVFGKSHATRKIAEACSGPTGSFLNEYWFEDGQYLRQSRQMIAPGMDNLVLQRVVD